MGLIKKLCVMLHQILGFVEEVPSQHFFLSLYIFCKVQV